MSEPRRWTLSYVSSFEPEEIWPGSGPELVRGESVEVVESSALDAALARIAELEAALRDRDNALAEARRILGGE